MRKRLKTNALPAKIFFKKPCIAKTLAIMRTNVQEKTLLYDHERSAHLQIDPGPPGFYKMLRLKML